jgi:hypothetical protein
MAQALKNSQILISSQKRSCTRIFENGYKSHSGGCRIQAPWLDLDLILANLSPQPHSMDLFKA